MITVDTREYDQHKDIPTYLPGCQIQKLEAGDYAYNDYDTNPVRIERCEISNLMQKLNSGELESQLRVAEDLYNKFYLLVEGVWDEEDNAVQPYKHLTMNLRGHRVKAYIATKRHGFFQYDRLEAFLIRIEEMGVRLLSSPNFPCSMRIIKLMETKQAEPPEGHKLFTSSRAVKIPTKFTKNPAVPRLMALCPRLPEKVALQLINDYGNIFGVLMTNPTDVEGFGKILQERLRENVGLKD